MGKVDKKSLGKRTGGTWGRDALNVLTVGPLGAIELHDKPSKGHGGGYKRRRKSKRRKTKRKRSRRKRTMKRKKRTGRKKTRRRR